ncbi:uncharacterized protein si:zfos-1056e6.1 [Oryzias melastigma]|uniref:uncharacterized protein si:zfos-1056e6.1 n=1 Tax=Oryzias melastigma TaxID=30732 RepID=UPI00168CC437|nr:uncharacterized protein si:zfos-1056e6.1 [Oryzias melastigma]
MVIIVTAFFFLRENIQMTGVVAENRLQVFSVWIRMEPRGKNVSADDQVETLREVLIPTAAESTAIRQVLTESFGIDSEGVVLKIRNHQGRLIPLSSCTGASSEHTPLLLEVTQTFQHVHPKPRSVPLTVITRSKKTRLQAACCRIQRLEELLPEIKLKQNDKLAQEIQCLKQKLRFLTQRMQVTSSHSWTGGLDRAPLW